MVVGIVLFSCWLTSPSQAESHELGIVGFERVQASASSLGQWAVKLYEKRDGVTSNVVCSGLCRADIQCSFFARGDGALCALGSWNLDEKTEVSAAQIRKIYGKSGWLSLDLVSISAALFL